MEVTLCVVKDTRGVCNDTAANDRRSGSRELFLTRPAGSTRHTAPAGAAVARPSKRSAAVRGSHGSDALCLHIQLASCKKGTVSIVEVTLGKYQVGGVAPQIHEMRIKQFSLALVRRQKDNSAGTKRYSYLRTKSARN